MPTPPNPPATPADPRQLRDAVRAGIPGALALVRLHSAGHRGLAAGSAEATRFTLADAQRVVARAHGFAGWAALQAHLAFVSAWSRSPHAQPVGAAAADPASQAAELLRLGCVTYGPDAGQRLQQAAVLLDERPDLARRSLHVAAAVGHVAAVRAALEADPAAVHAPGGPFAWRPLLYVAFSRVCGPAPTYDQLAVAELLLRAGADPNDGYLWEGRVPPRTALAGALDDGDGWPPHPHRLQLARLLLGAGANANDAAVCQQLRACPGQDDTEVLELLLRAGLGRGDGGPWHWALAPHHPAPRQLLADQLLHAARHGLPRRVAALLTSGADPRAVSPDPAFEGRTPYAVAVEHGHRTVARLLAAAGADDEAVDDLTRLVGAVLAAEESTATALLRADPDLADRLRRAEPHLVGKAAATGHGEPVRLAVALGLDVDHRQVGTALHEAARRGDRQVVLALLELGADRTVRDLEDGATPQEWAAAAAHPELAALLTQAAGPPPRRRGP